VFVVDFAVDLAGAFGAAVVDVVVVVGASVVLVVVVVDDVVAVVDIEGVSTNAALWSGKGPTALAPLDGMDASAPAVTAPVTTRTAVTTVVRLDQDLAAETTIRRGRSFRTCNRSTS
jgi:hypothetical protein